MGKYGPPYMGSKSAIADKIIAVLPSGDRFIDLFGGGGAMTHAAELSGKYGEVIYSDADPLACEYITRAIRGDYSPERFTPRWISREEFFAKKDSDPYIRYCWSFGNGGKSYMYGRHIEGLKRRLFEWAVFGQNATFIAGLGVPVADAPDGGIAERLAFLKKHIRCRLTTLGTVESLVRLGRVGSLGCLGRVASLEGLARVTVLHRGYRVYQYRAGDVVYCDPPYDSRAQYALGDFDFTAFMDWAARVPCYVSSYEINDSRFRIYHEFKKMQLLSATKNCAVIERLYAAMRPRKKFRRHIMAKQQTPYKMTKLSEIRPYGRNPRIIPQAAVDAVAKSIAAFGFRQPIVVDGHGVILAGHTRYRAAQQLGLAEVPVVWQTDITEIQARGYRIADNKTAEIAAWDRDALDAEVRELAGMDDGALASLGMSDWELERILHDCAAPEGARDLSVPAAAPPAAVYTQATDTQAPPSIPVANEPEAEAGVSDHVHVTLAFPDRDSAGAFVAAYRDAVASLGGTITEL